MFKSEIYKLFKYKAFWIILCLGIAVSVLVALITAPKDLTTVLVSLDSATSLFLVFLVNTIARHDFQEGTMKNIIASGIKRSAVFRAKLFTSYIAGILLLAVDGAIKIVVAFVKGATFQGDIVNVLISVALQILMILLYASMFFSFSYLLYKGPWGMLISLFIALFSTSVLAVFDFFFKLPFQLHVFTIGNIAEVASKMVYNLDTLIPVGVSTLLTCAVTILVYAVTAKREIK